MIHIWLVKVNEVEPEIAFRTRTGAFDFVRHWHTASDLVVQVRIKNWWAAKDTDLLGGFPRIRKVELR